MCDGLGGEQLVYVVEGECVYVFVQYMLVCDLDGDWYV